MSGARIKLGPKLIILLFVTIISAFAVVEVKSENENSTAVISTTAESTGLPNVTTSAYTENAITTQHEPSTTNGSNTASWTSESMNATTVQQPETTASPATTALPPANNTIETTSSITSSATSYSGSTEDVTTPSSTSSPPDCKGFDAASFFGGILLALGVVFIIFVIYRWYRSRHEGVPYHQF